MGQSLRCWAVAMVLVLSTGGAAPGGSLFAEGDRASLRWDLEKVGRHQAEGRTAEARRILERWLTVLEGRPTGKRSESAQTLRAAMVRAWPDAVDRVDAVLVAEAVHRVSSSASFLVNERRQALRESLRVLEPARPLSPAGLLARGTCLLELDRPAEAVRDLTRALAADPTSRPARTLLAKALFLKGEPDRAGEVASSLLSETRDRETAELTAVCLLESSRKTGRPGAALQACTAWLDGRLAPEVSSPLWRAACEMQVEEGNLAAGLDAFTRVVLDDRVPLEGGLVRAVRGSKGAPGPAREKIGAALRQTCRQMTIPSLPCLRVAGDFLAGMGQPGVALRHYAASVDREAEAPDLIARFRRSVAPGVTVNPGDAARWLSQGKPMEFPSDPAAWADLQKTANWILEQARTPADRIDLCLDAGDFNNVGQQTALGAANFIGTFSAGPQRWRSWRGVFRSDRDRPAAWEELLAVFLAGDVRSTLQILDQKALLAWRTVYSFPGQADVVGAVTVGTLPRERILGDATVPPALVKIRDAQVALTSAKSDEVTRLARILDVVRDRQTEEVRSSPLARDPLAIDLDGNGRIDLTPHTGEGGTVDFDLTATGSTQRIQWLEAGRDGWLCEDVDGNGRIDSGRELFGTAGGFTDGFEKLGMRDRDGDGAVRGAELDGLSIWRDANGDGKVDPGELLSVAEHGLTSIEIPRIGLRSAAVVGGRRALCAEVLPNVIPVIVGGW